MTGIVFAGSSAAIALQGAFDSALGYPKPGVDRGPGRHAPPAASQTTHCANILTNGSQFALQTSTEIDAAVSVPIGVGVRTTLDASWT